MSETDGAVAGRLSVIVEASLRGFKKRLEAGVEKASKGVTAKVGVEIDATNLRRQLQAKVDEAAAGVKASVTVNVDVDVKQVAAKVKAAAKAAETSVTVDVKANTDGVVEDAVEAAEEAEKAAPNIFVRMRTKSKEFLAGVASDIAKAKAMAAASQINVPVGAGGGGGIRLRTLFRGSVIFGLISLIQPAIGAIGQLIAGLTSIVGAAAPAVGVLSAIPISLAAIVQGAFAGKLAFQGMGDAMGLLAEKQATLARGEEWTTEQQEKLTQALSEMHPEAIKAAKIITSLRGSWVAMRKEVQGAFFSKITDEIKPLATVMLPLLSKRLAGTAEILGRNTRNAMKFLASENVQSKLGRVMGNNNVIFGDFLYMIGQFGKGALDFLDASRKFGRGVGDTMRSVGDWFSGKMEKGRKSGSLEDFLDRASEKATQLWDITRNLGGGFAGIFRAAAPSGERLLATFQETVETWNKWVNSDDGQNFLTDFFDSTEEGFREWSRIARDTFQRVAKWAGDPKIAGMLKQLRTQLGPALGDVLEDVSNISGEGTINFLSELTTLASNLTPVLEPMAAVIGTFAKVLDGLNAAMQANPELTKKIATVLGLFLAFKATKGLLKVAFKITGLGALTKAAALIAGIKSGPGKFSFKNLIPGISGGKNPWGKGVTPVWVTNPGFDGKGTPGVVPGGAPDKTSKIPKALKVLGAVSIVAAAGALTIYGLKEMFDGLDGEWDKDKGKWARQRRAEQGATPPVAGNNISSGRTGSTKSGAPTDLTRSLAAAGDYKGIPQVTAKDVAKMAAAGVKSAAQAMNERNNAQRDNLTSMGVDPYGAQMRRLMAGPKRSAPVVPRSGPGGQGGTAGPAIDTKKLNAAKAAVEKIRPAVKRVSAEFANATRKSAQMGTKTVRSSKQTQTAISQVPKRLKRMGDEYATVGRKAVSSARQTAKGSKGLETAAKNASRAVKQSTKGIEKSFDAIAPKMRQAASAAGKSAAQINRQITSKVKPLRGTVNKAMDGVVKAVRSKVGPAKGASTQVGAGVKQPLSQLRGPLNAAGINAMDGFVQGIQSRGAAAVAAARSIAAQVQAVTRSEMEIRSPSRKMRRLGEFVMAGLDIGIVNRGRTAVKNAGKVTRKIANSIAMEMSMGGKKAVALSSKQLGAAAGKNIDIGPWLLKGRKKLRKQLKDYLTDGFREAITKGTPKQVQNAFKRFYKIIDKATPNTKAGRARMAALKREFREEMKLLEANAKARQLKQKAIDAAQAAVDSLKERRDNVKESLKSTTNEAGSITNIAEANGGYVTPARLIAQLKKKVSKALEFKKLLADLRSKGLGEEAYTQLLELGFDAGLPIARQLAKGDGAAMAEINRLQGELDSIATDTGEATSAHFFDGGIKAGEALVQQLKDDLADLEEVGRTMGKAFLSELQSVLGLDLGVKGGGDLEAPAAPGKGGDGGAADKGRHEWVPIGPKNRKCKQCGKARKNAIHSNSGTDAVAASEVQVKDAPKGFTGLAQVVGAAKGAKAGKNKPGLKAIGGAGKNARATATEPAMAGGGDVTHITLSGIPDKATAKDVLGETQFQMKKIKAGGRHVKRARK